VRQVAALHAQARRGALGGEIRYSGPHEIANGGFGSHARAAGRTPVQVVFDERPLGSRELAVDVRRDERID
jgi:hypothetical protein